MRCRSDRRGVSETAVSESPLLFPGEGAAEPRALAPGAVVLTGFAVPIAPALVEAVRATAAVAPFRHMLTPGGRAMSVAMTNCGPLGWVTDHKGYRYSPTDPDSGRPWPPMPQVFLGLAAHAAAEAGYADFRPDACLINRYEPGTRMGLHQDRDEQDFSAPIVSVSLGLPAVFLWGGTAARSGRPRRIALQHGDVVVWGGPSRLNFHGIAPLAEGEFLDTGRFRFNLTFRRAL